MVYPMYILAFAVRAKLQKWGNSLGLRIPKAFAREASVGAGSTVELTVDRAGRLIVERVIGPEYDLDHLLAGVSSENLHDEVPTGERRGRESW